MNRRPLAETLIDLVDAMLPSPDQPSGVKVTRLAVDLPVEIRMQRSGDGWALLCDLPLWRWRTDFDETPSRLSIQFGEGVADERV